MANRVVNPNEEFFDDDLESSLWISFRNLLDLFVSIQDLKDSIHEVM